MSSVHPVSGAAVAGNDVATHQFKYVALSANNITKLQKAATFLKGETAGGQDVACYWESLSLTSARAPFKRNCADYSFSEYIPTPDSVSRNLNILLETASGIDKECSFGELCAAFAAVKDEDLTPPQINGLGFDVGDLVKRLDPTVHRDFFRSKTFGGDFC